MSSCVKTPNHYLNAESRRQNNQRSFKRIQPSLPEVVVFYVTKSFSRESKVQADQPIDFLENLKVQKWSTTAFHQINCLTL